MSVSCIIINHKRDVNFPFTQKKVVHFDTLFFSFIIKNLLKHLASISIVYSRDKPRQQLLPGLLIVFYRRHLRKRTIEMIFS